MGRGYWGGMGRGKMGGSRRPKGGWRHGPYDNRVPQGVNYRVPPKAPPTLEEMVADHVNRMLGDGYRNAAEIADECARIFGLDDRQRALLFGVVEKHFEKHGPA